MLIAWKLRNNTLREFLGMKGDVMTTGSRQGTYYRRRQRERAGEEGLGHGFQHFAGWELSGRELVPARSVGDVGSHMAWEVVCCSLYSCYSSSGPL